MYGYKVQINQPEPPIEPPDCRRGWEDEPECEVTITKRDMFEHFMNHKETFFDMDLNADDFSRKFWDWYKEEFGDEIRAEMNG